MSRFVAGALASCLLVFAGTAAAQPRDDVPWEERRIPYDGGPIRPGAQIHGEYDGGLMSAGISSLLGGYALTLLGLATDPVRPGFLIPLAGPWLEAFGVFSPVTDPGVAVLLIVPGVLQAAGVALIIAALALPNYWLVFDAPIGQPSPFQVSRIEIVPTVSSREIGLNLVVETM